MRVDALGQAQREGRGVVATFQQTNDLASDQIWVGFRCFDAVHTRHQLQVQGERNAKLVC